MFGSLVDFFGSTLFGSSSLIIPVLLALILFTLIFK